MKLYRWLIFFLLAYSAQAQDELVVVSPHWEGIRYEIGTAFSKNYQIKTGRDVKIRWMDVGGTSDILRFIDSEFKNRPDSIGIDLLFGGGTDPFVQLKNKQLLISHKLPEEVAAAIGKKVVGMDLHDPAGYFYSPVMAAFGFMCNREVLRRINVRQPQSWRDLTQSGLYSWLGSADPRKSGSLHMVYEVLLQAYGWDEGWRLIFALAHNMRPIVSNSGQVAKDVASGELACGFSIDSHAWAQARELGEENISFVTPSDGGIANGDAIAIIKGAPNLKVAEAFIDFTLSEEAQKLFFFRRGQIGGPVQYELSRLPVRPAIYAMADKSAISINPFSWKADFAYDNDLGAKRWALVNDLFATFVLERQYALRITPDNQPPITFDELKALIKKGVWENQSTRATTIAKWSDNLENASTNSLWSKAWIAMLFLGAIIFRMVKTLF